MIINGDSLTVLKAMKSESIDCIVTSSPYWALRDYKTEGQIWDGDSNCQHEWGESFIGSDNLRFRGVNAAVGNNNNIDLYPATKKDKGGNFCQKCGAWKGSLGLETTFDLYIKHLCDIFDECKRVLKKTGTCWVNLGDTYSQSGGQGNQSKEAKSFGNYKSHKVDNMAGKCLCQIPARFSIEMVNRGWILRNTIIWHKPNCMPSSASDRFTVDFEYVFFFVKSKKYYFEQQLEHQITQENRPHGVVRNREYNYQGKYKLRKNYSQKEIAGQVRDDHDIHEAFNPLGRNKRCIWDITTKPYKKAHFATYPEELCETPIKSGCPEFICNKCGQAREKIIDEIKGDWQPTLGASDDAKKGGKRTRLIVDRIDKGYTDCGCNAGFRSGIVLDPFSGAGTTGVVAKMLNREYIGIELNKEYCRMSKKRIDAVKVQTTFFIK